MKKITVAALSFLVLFSACKKDDIRIEMPVPEDQMHLQASAGSVAVSFFTPDEEAVRFNWQPTGFEAEGIPYRYFFKMDIAGNDFATSIDKIELTGSNSISFTHKQMEQYLSGWKIQSGTQVRIEAEIIAAPVESGSIENQKYRRPEVSKTEFDLVSNTEIYLQIGGESLRLSGTGLLLMVEKGTYKCTAGESESLDVVVPGNGLWEFSIDFDTHAIKVKRPRLWLLGDACEGGWNIPDMPEFKADGDLMKWSGVLMTGEMKFPMEINSNGNFNMPYLMPETGDAPLENGKVQYIPVNGGTDLKWRVSQAGGYDITVDYETMTVTFTKNFDLKWGGIWMVGDATEGGWASDPFRIKLSYDYGSPAHGVFLFEGSLKAGEFKFPLEERTFEVPYLMPKNAGGDGLSLLPGDGESCDIEFVEANKPNYDHKWKVNPDRAGNYRLELDTENMKMTVHRL